MAVRYGVLGEHLAHSFSPHIHNLLGNQEYQLLEMNREQLDAFLQKRDFCGINVTIPYKKTVIPYCDQLTEIAARIGSVNTLTINSSGKMIGDNTDYAGFSYLAHCAGIDFSHAKVLVLGSGGASLTAITVAHDLGASEVITVSRSGPIDYHNVYQIHGDADIIINTTPCGMYPNNYDLPIDISAFSACRGFLDMIYNPLRTALLLKAAEAGIPCCGGLPMLVEQARRANEIFFGNEIPVSRTAEIVKILEQELESIILIGMPGSGKTSIGQALAHRLKRNFIDLDNYIAEKYGSNPEQIILTKGEEIFRDMESAAVKDIASKQSMVIATGGGTVLRKCNIDSLKQNGKIIFIDRKLENLAVEGRPLSRNGAGLAELYQKRLPLYQQYADKIIVNNGEINNPVEQILAYFQGVSL